MKIKSRFLRGGAFVFIGAAGTLMAMAIPAVAASGSGSGGSGTLTTDLALQHAPGHQQKACAVAGNNFGSTTTISGTIASGSASYTGPITYTWTVDQTNGPWYEGPGETNGDNSACNDPSNGDPWEITGSATGTNSAGSTVNCTFSSGTYSRTNDIDVVVALDGVCSIQEDPPDGTDSVANSATSVELLQTLGTCVDNFPPAFIPESCATSGDSFTAS